MLFRNINLLFVLLPLAMVSATPASATEGPVLPEGDWDAPALEVSLPGGSGDALYIGDYYQVLVTAQEKGHLYLVQRNSREKADGTLRLVPVERKLPGYSDGTAFIYPPADSLEAEPPVGPAEVTAIYSQRPLPLDSLAARPGAAGEYRLQEAEFAALMEQARRADPSLKMAVKTTPFKVAVADGQLEYTTRGIARQINSALSDPGSGSEEEGVLTSFDAHIQFEFGTAVPTHQGQLQLDAFGQVLAGQDFGTIDFIVAGHTDDIGETDFNMGLSERRARAVIEYLRENFQIESERMSFEAHGESMPYVDNGDPDVKPLNRRVEFTLLN